MKTILLDLNFTLAKKVKIDYTNWQYYPKEDVYSLELISELVKGDYNIILITARPDIYKKITVSQIESAGLKCNRYVFKPYNKRFTKVHDFKKNFLSKLLKSGKYKLNDIIAIESSKETTRQYKKLGLVKVYTREEFLFKIKRGIV